VPLYPNYVYNSAQVNRAYTDLMSLGYFKSAKIAFVEQPRSVDVTNYVSFIGASADSTQTRFTKEGYLECNILCTPALKQSFKVDLEGSTTSSFYGLKATVGYQNRNIFRGAEALDVSFTAGYEFMKAPDAKKKRATEFGVTTGLTFPRFLVPWRTRRFRSGEPAKDQGGAFCQFSGPPLLSAYAFECGNHLPVDQQPLLFVLAAARRYQRRRCESAGLDLPRQDDE